MSIPNGARWFKKIVRGRGVTGATVRVFDSVIHDNQAVLYTRVILENETNGGNTARVGVLIPADFFTYHFFATFAADVPQILTDILLPVSAHERLAVDFFGSTDGDVLTASLVGFYYPPEKR